MLLKRSIVYWALSGCAALVNVLLAAFPGRGLAYVNNVQQKGSNIHSGLVLHNLLLLCRINHHVYDEATAFEIQGQRLGNRRAGGTSYDNHFSASTIAGASRSALPRVCLLLLVHYNGACAHKSNYGGGNGPIPRHPVLQALKVARRRVWNYAGRRGRAGGGR